MNLEIVGSEDLEKFRRLLLADIRKIIQMNQPKVVKDKGGNGAARHIRGYFANFSEQKTDPFQKTWRDLLLQC